MGATLAAPVKGWLYDGRLRIIAGLDNNAARTDSTYGTRAHVPNRMFKYRFNWCLWSLQPARVRCHLATMNKPKVAGILTKAGVALWLGPLVLLVGTFVPAMRSIASMPVLDFLVFAIIWAYILIAPAAAILALRLSDQQSKARRLAKIQLVVWGLAFVASVTLI